MDAESAEIAKSGGNLILGQNANWGPSVSRRKQIKKRKCDLALLAVFGDRKIRLK